MHIPIIVAVVGFLTGAWLFFGFMGYGMLYAFFQRSFTPEEAAKDLYKDMKSAAVFIPQGFFGLVKVIHYLVEHDGWNEEDDDAIHGYKWLPRHEYRYR